ncbi:hypothetical protein APA_416 [Pseudanabaena sp. lw0831]|uniref:hypothetical protein n=1 Tax=Pseudanabaena sp. lw0831 TaxID=1357935 RepID=UPI0019157989|nr:hypothetical protein [Pseudanabaena sp. lw0831]GBO52747.1 hypothetical protein APA_416 [Pseudanabaena sp. lw0831]
MASTSTAEKQKKIKNIVKGLAEMKKLQQEAVKKKKARQYIKTAGRVIRAGLWIAPFVVGLISPLVEPAEAEEVDETDELDISDELDYMDLYDPELIDSVNEIFEQFDGLDDLFSDEIIDSIVNDIDPNDLDMNDVVAAESIVIEMCIQIRYSC